MALKKITFKNFLECFPNIELPVTLDENTHHTFSQENRPLAPALIQHYIIPHLNTEVDEFTEFIPCFQIPSQPKFEAVVFWRAGLLDYNYIMNTYEKDGSFIKSYHIGGTKSDGQNIARLLCTIQPNLQIHMAAGQGDINQPDYSPTDTKVFKIELLDNGEAHIEMDENIWT